MLALKDADMACLDIDSGVETRYGHFGTPQQNLYLDAAARYGYFIEAR